MSILDGVLPFCFRHSTVNDPVSHHFVSFVRINTLNHAMGPDVEVSETTKKDKLLRKTKKVISPSLLFVFESDAPAPSDTQIRSSSRNSDES